MQIVRFDADKHYTSLTREWKRFGWNPGPPPEFLPKEGYVAMDGDKFIAALFAYIEPGTIAYVSWPTGAYDTTEHERIEAFANLFTCIKTTAIMHRCKFIYGATAVGAYKKLMSSWGMIPTESSLFSYLLPLTENSDVSFLQD